MLRTKLNKPSASSKLIFRKELIEKLGNANKKKLILVSAPAGYGKSTLISQWIDQFKLTNSWYSLDKSDNDIISFMKYTISGIQLGLANFGTDAINLLEANTNASYETIATSIINDLYEIGSPVTLVFDDYHLIENKEVNEFVYYLIGNLPAHVQVVIITRSDPAIPLARLRSQQFITDIRLSDLCFNTHHILDFFKKALNIHLSNEDVINLESKTEGWAAGLQLTALSMQGKDDVSEFVKKLKGDNRHIMDYLFEEVLQQQSTEFRDFLLCSSILNQFNASLCNNLLGISNSQEIIEHFEKNNMFIIPLDNERNWFRYHHLFASLLQHRLAALFKDKVPELHSAASQWFENNNQPIFALEHSLAAGDKQKALTHFSNVINQLWETSQYQTVLQFGSKFTDAELIENVDLSFNYFWILFQSGQLEQAESLMGLLQKHTTNKAELAMVYVCINNLKVSTGDIESAYTYSDLALQHLDKDEDYWSILALLSLGEVHLLRLELSESFKMFDQAAKRASGGQLIYFEMINRLRSTFVAWMMGDLAGGYTAVKELLGKLNALNKDRRTGIEFLSSILCCYEGNFLINTNQIEQGLQKSLRGYELSRKTTNALLISSCTLLLAEAYYLIGEYKKAVPLIEELDVMPYKQASKFLCILSDSLKSKLYLLTNNQDKLNQLFKKEVQENRSWLFEASVFRIDRARYQIARGEILEAIELLHKVSEDLKSKKAYGLLAETAIIQAKAHALILEHQKAINFLSRAILQSQEVGFVRVYIKEGEEVEALLKEIKTVKRSGANKQLEALDMNYVDSLLRAFDKEKKRPLAPSEDSLSSRELDTLKLIAENLTNQEIAGALFISITTVKTHVRNILLKLEAKNRTDAVVKAKDKGVL